MFAVILLSIAITLLALIIELRRRNHGQTPPGPFQWPIIGNLRMFRQLCRKNRGQHRAFLDLSRQYSSDLVSLRIGSNVIVVHGYELIQKVLNSDEFDGRPWNEFIKLRNMGLRKGITMSDGPEWKEIRAWFVRSLREIGFGRAFMASHTETELQFILDGIKDGGVIRMQSLIAPSVFNVIWTMATGKRFADEAKLTNFLNLMGRRSKAFDMAGGILSVFPWIRHVAPEASGYNLLVTVNNEIKSVLMGVIEDHKRTYLTGESRGDLIDMFLKEMEDRKGTDTIFTEDQLFIILLDVLIAGSVTTTTTLDFLFLRMTAHQDIQRRVHEEIDTMIGCDRNPDLKDRPKLPYVEAVITESHRLQTIVPISGPRRVLRECSLGGYRIPKGSSVLMNIWGIHMDPEYYPNPHLFEPERFIKDGSHVPDEKLIFFGRGHRRCPGEADAKSIVFLLFVGIMQRYQLLPVPGQGTLDVEPNCGITQSPKPYEVLLVPRKGVCFTSKLNTEDS